MTAAHRSDKSFILEQKTERIEIEVLCFDSTTMGTEIPRCKDLLSNGHAAPLRGLHHRSRTTAPSCTVSESKGIDEY